MREYGIHECHVETDRFNWRRAIVRDPIIRLFLEHVESNISCHIEVKQLNSGIRTFPYRVQGPRKRLRGSHPDVFHHNDFFEIVGVRIYKQLLVKRWSDPKEYPKLTTIKVEGRIRDALDLGFASTILSFQGSEVDSVICLTRFQTRPTLTGTFYSPSCHRREREGVYRGREGQYLFVEETFVQEGCPEGL